MEVSWVKLSVGFLDNRKIKQIRKLPSGDSIALVWVFLMCLAGKINDGGFIRFTEEIPYTDEMLAVEFGMDVNIIRVAMQVFEQYGMVELVDSAYYLSGWEKYQDQESLEKIRQQNRNRVARYRERKKYLVESEQKLIPESNDMHKEKPDVTPVTQDVTLQETCRNAIDKEEDKEKEIEKNILPPKGGVGGNSDEKETVFTVKEAMEEFDGDLKEAVSEWLNYKKERRESYKAQGLKSFVTTVKKSAAKFGEVAVCDCIRESMANNYHGITYAKLEKSGKQNNTNQSGSYRSKKPFTYDYSDTEGSL